MLPFNATFDGVEFDRGEAPIKSKENLSRPPPPPNLAPNLRPADRFLGEKKRGDSIRANISHPFSNLSCVDLIKFSRDLLIS